MITIITTAFNNTEYIEECLDSILTSAKNLEFEVLVGIDNCEKTIFKCVEIKKKYPENVKFLFFTEHSGTYVIRNTLAKEAKYNKLMFFDSDDIMNDILVSNVNQTLDNYQHVRYNYHTFHGVFSENIKRTAIPGNHFHTGTFGILKDIFLQNNGFEPWICAADGEFYWRLIKNNVKSKDLKILGLFYRRHGNNLTAAGKTSMNSPLRKMYHNLRDVKISKDLFKPLPELKISNFLNINNIDLKFLKNLIKNDKNYDISVVIPIYKNTEFIDECINSIISSGKNNLIEVLVGIDGCLETLEYMKTKKYPDFVTVFYFNENNGPYDIKNTLTVLSNSNKVLFFDSDDIMTETTINESVKHLNSYDIVRLRYETYVKQPIKKEIREFGEGVFAINKELFLSMNGFEPWMCAADSDFMGRLYKNRPRIHHTNNVSFYYRKHSNSLTEKKETGMMSNLRAKYFKISKSKKGHGNPDKLNTRNFIVVGVDTFEIVKETHEYYKNRKTILDKVLNPAPRKVVGQPTKKKDPVINDRTDLLYTNPKPLTRTITPNKPDNRQELINLKNNTNKTIHKQIFNTKPERRTGINPITIGGKSRT